MAPSCLASMPIRQKLAAQKIQVRAQVKSSTIRTERRLTARSKPSAPSKARLTPPVSLNAAMVRPEPSLSPSFQEFDVNLHSTADVEMCCSLPILGGNVCDETMALNGSFYRCRDRGGFNGSSGVILYDNDKPWVFFDLISSWTNAINASDLKINVVEAAARSGLQLGTLSPNKSAADAATIAANPCVAWRTDGTCKCLAVEATNSSRDCSDEVESPLDPYGEYQSDSTGP